MANDDGTFCFEDLQKAFNRIEQKYENKTDAMLMAMANTASREYAAYMTQIDVHGPGKLRVNRVVVNNDEFFKAFDITEKDRMWVAPENRAKIR